MASSNAGNGIIQECFPNPAVIDLSIPSPAREYLEQAEESLHAPAGATMLAASAVDAMMKSKGFTKGTLYSRIDLAKQNSIITEDMATWAHRVRLDANEPRHADTSAPLPEQAAAKETLAFAKALADFLFVLPARVEKGLQTEATE